jgi:hypothetical protein
MSTNRKTLEELVSEIEIVDPVLYAAQSELLSAFSAVRYKPEPTEEDIDRFLEAVRVLSDITKAGRK